MTKPMLAFATREAAQIVCARLLLRSKTDHALVFVKLPGIGVLLIDNKHLLRCGVRPDVAIDMIAIRALGALKIPIVGRHLYRP